MVCLWLGRACSLMPFGLFVHGLSKRAVNNFGDERLAGFRCHAVPQASAYVRHFKPFDAIVGYVGNQFNVVYVEFAVGLALGVNFAE